MMNDLATHSADKVMRALFVAALCLLLSATAAAAQEASDPETETCADQSLRMAEIGQWLQAVGADGAAPPGSARTPAAKEGCLACHGDAGRLIGMVTPPAAPPEDGCASAPSRPPFLGYFVNETFPDSLHGQLGCSGCHGGQPEANMTDAAHQGLRDPSATCANCHAGEVARHDTSLHKTLSGMAHALQLRTGQTELGNLKPVWQADCASCHTTCGDCHVALPDAVGGGLIKGHEFMRRAPMKDSCALCHGSRAGGEYLGQFEGLKPDIHFEAGMHCLDCHTNDLHGDGELYQSRWDVAGRAQCSDCHAVSAQGGVPAHGEMHVDVACQVCHAQPYQNCFECHTGEEDGAYFRRAGSREMMLKIGRNTAEGYPFGIVTLRHNPVARDSFEHFGAPLPRFDDHPNWKTAAPHNIRRVTPQNRSCATCHQDETLFLDHGDLLPDGPAANRDIIVPWP